MYSTQQEASGESTKREDGEIDPVATTAQSELLCKQISPSLKYQDGIRLHKALAKKPKTTIEGAQHHRIHRPPINDQTAKWREFP
jgi:hypothetical protein